MSTATKSPKTDKKTERIVARLSPEDKMLMERAAEYEGRSLASFVVTNLRKHAREVVEKETAIRLSEEESRRLMEILNAPPGPASDAFKKAFKEYRETIISDVNVNV